MKNKIGAMEGSGAHQTAMAFMRLTEVLEKAAGKRLDSGNVFVFLKVAEAGSGGIDNAGLARQLPMSKPAISRAVQALGPSSWQTDTHGFKKPGLNWLRVDSDPRDGRSSVWTLSPLGAEIYSRVKALYR